MSRRRPAACSTQPCKRESRHCARTAIHCRIRGASSKNDHRCELRASRFGHGWQQAVVVVQWLSRLQHHRKWTEALQKLLQLMPDRSACASRKHTASRALATEARTSGQHSKCRTGSPYTAARDRRSELLQPTQPLFYYNIQPKASRSKRSAVLQSSPVHTCLVLQAISHGIHSLRSSAKRRTF